MRRLASIFIVVALLFSLTSCYMGEGAVYTETYLEFFNTVTTFSAFKSVSKAEFSRLGDKVEKMLSEYHKLYDIYFEYAGINNLKTVNDNAGIAPVKVDERIIDLLDYAKVLYDTTAGEMNIAMGAVLKIWHDARESAKSGNTYVPDMEALTAAKTHTDIEKIVIDREGGTVYLADPEMSLDVGAIAKGYATEMVANMLESYGEEGYALNVGGNIRLIGSKITARGEEPFKVGISHPRESGTIRTVEISSVSLVTSGDYERYFIYEGDRYHHIIDKDTLMPAAYYASVSIVAEDSGLADALSTAIFAMNLDSGRALIDSLVGVEAMWITPSLEIYHTDGFPLSE